MALIDSPLFLSFVTLAVILGLIAWSTQPTTPEPDLPGPRGWPIVGSLFQRGSDPAHTYHMWSKIYGPVFKMRLANRWVVVVNGAEAGDELLASAQYGAIFQSRPSPHTLNSLLKLASPKAVTLGTSPYDDLLKGKRRLAIASVSPAATKTYHPIIDKAAQYFIRSLDNANKKAQGGPIDPFPIFVKGAQVLAITVLCGASVEEASTLLDDCPFPMRRLGEIRNINGHWRDWFPFLRVLPFGKLYQEAVEVAKYRNGKLDWMLDRARSYAEQGIDKPCAAGTILGENNHGLSDVALTSVTNSMVSSGLDAHMPYTFLWGLGILAANKDIQEKAYEATLRQDKLGDEMNWDRDNYLTGFVKELGRWSTTFRLALARETMSKDLVWKGHFIPVGTTVYTNVHAMNRDPARFANPDKFSPERYMTGSPEAERTMPHYGFGVGRRNCPAIHLVVRELYCVFKEILQHYTISIHDGEKEFHAVDGCADGLEFNQAPKKFRINMQVRDQQKLNAYLAAEL